VAKSRRSKTKKNKHPAGVTATTRANSHPSGKFGVDQSARHLVHELWPELVLHNLSTLEATLWRMVNQPGYKEGFTDGEREVLKEKRKQLKQLVQEMNLIYFRLKQ
jgi:hypothetical protein